MIWPFGRRKREAEREHDRDHDRQQQQIRESAERIVETTARVRGDAQAEQKAAADEMKDAIARRLSGSDSLRSILEQVVGEQHRDIFHPKNHKGRS